MGVFFIVCDIVERVKYILFIMVSEYGNYNYIKKSCKTVKSMIKIYYAKVAN